MSLLSVLIMHTCFFCLFFFQKLTKLLNNSGYGYFIDYIVKAIVDNTEDDHIHCTFYRHTTKAVAF